MHLLVREALSLDEAGEAVDLGHTPAPLVLLASADSDLSAASAAWSGMAAPPGLRLANLARLRHPMSVDLYVERVIARARCVVVRLLGGLDYWRYGAEEIAAACRAAGIALAFVPGDGRPDARLAALATVPRAMAARLDALLGAGGPDNAARAIRLMAHLAGLGPDRGEDAAPLPLAAWHTLEAPADGPAGRAAIVFYRSHALAGDTEPVAHLAGALATRGLGVRAIHVGSLKSPVEARFVRAALDAYRPDVVLNLTGFAARTGETGSPLEAADAPVLQLVTSGSTRAAWEADGRGLSQTDLAVHVALPELDGRLLAGAASFKAELPGPDGLEHTRRINQADPAALALAADRALGWARLRRAAPAERRIALVLSDMPDAPGQIAHAVGLDGIASAAAILRRLAASGYRTGAPGPEALVASLDRAPPAPCLAVAEYRRLAAALPTAFRDAVDAAWGAPEHDPAAAAGHFTLRLLDLGGVRVAVQPDRGIGLDRKAGYHDPALPPRHAYVAFYLWLRDWGAHALLHLGTHGTLEWLPGKAAALSAGCAPVALLRGLPVIYPFIVNNPGEAAVAKRRLGAVTIGHLTPPLVAAGSHGAAPAVERLIEEYAAAEALDGRRAAALRRQILDAAAAAGLDAEAGLGPGLDPAEAVALLDGFLCDARALLVRDGLHVFGEAPPGRDALLAGLREGCPDAPPASLAARLDASAPAEADALLGALAGRFVPPGPAGAPTRGRADVLPTGRNLAPSDPRAMPAPSAMPLATRAAEALLRRHRLERGEWPRRLVMDLWGSASLRTGGEDFCTALVLMGLAPLWDEAARLRGIEILPLAGMDRPRVDVTLRISGLFRDCFAEQIALFDRAVRTLAARDEDAADNPIAGDARGLAGAALRRATLRVFGAPAGSYGAGGEGILRGHDAATLGEAYLAGSSGEYGEGREGSAGDAFAERVAAADAFLHMQDSAMTDVLDGTEHAAHAGGFFAAAAAAGNLPAMWQLDTTRGAPVARGLAEEVRRVARGRAGNPAWISGMRRHGYRGAAEIARALDGLHGFAATLPERFDAQYELVWGATLGDAETARFLAEANPRARDAMLARFAEAAARGFWHPRRNDLHPADAA